ncbi:MAG: polyphosphate polymerase domain-containing protein [Clostridium sp.]|nr:polyphosphate polymerase domain-containing protein [Clostridium sp.]
MKKEAFFQRYEFKYLLTKEQQARLLTDAGKRLIPDEYSHSSIRNLYLDTPDFRLIRRSMERPVYKEKLRLRSYGKADGEHLAFMELKKKYHSVVYKRRLCLPHTQALRCLSGNSPWPDTQIGREINYSMHFYPDLEPRVFLSYERDSWKEAEGGLRITFDEDIRFRTDVLTLDSEPWGTKLLKTGQVLMELKAPGAIPLWMVRLLTDMKLYKTSFSKYGTAYEKMTEQTYKGVKRYA